ncbi:MAG: ExeM/NucH family extracellular endonuclease, partial [Ilumatobacteraceae bacterium]
YFTEYIEGTSNNKALEIYNDTGAAVNLAAGLYNIQMFFNGNPVAGLTFNLTGTNLADGDVYVVAQSLADPAILAQADQTNGSGWFNGDDAVVLVHGTTVVDSIGQAGFDPGSQWGADLTSTADNTLRRASTICAGDTIPDDEFDPSAEWAGFATDTFDGLGAHQAAEDCGGDPGDPGGPAAVLINELDADTPSSDVAEFVELFDGGAGNTALDGLVVVFYNGSIDTSYAAFDLDGFTTDADGYFVLGNAGINPDLEFGGGGLQNGADAVAVYAGDAAGFPNGTAVTTADLVEAVVYDTADADDAELLVLLGAGQPQVDENDDGAGADESSQRCPDGSGGARNTSTFATWAPTPGVANLCEIVLPPLECSAGATITPIHDVQGNGLTSTEAGDIVEIDGVDVGDFQNNGQTDNGDLNGFHVQEEDADADADPATSEGVFVFAPAAADVAVGDHVRVRGTVSEFGTGTTVTEISDAAVAACADPAAFPTVTAVTLPVAAIDDLERSEGMYVTLPQALSISEYFNFDRFGEIVLTDGRQFQPTAVFEPGSQEAADLADLNSRSRITLDDGRTTQNPDPAIHPNGGVFDLTNLFRGGDLVQNATGVIDHSFGLYRIHPTQGADFTPVNPRPAEPADVGGGIQLASFNVLNYFNGDGQGGGFPTSRGALNPEEFTRQRDKIIDAIVRLESEVVGVMEIENDGYDQFGAIQDLVNGLNDASGAGTWAFIDPGVSVIGTDEIAVGLLYQPAAVSPVGAAAILDSSVDPRFDDTANRPALAQSFIDSTTGGVFTVAVNHLKSKGSGCGPGDDDPQQGNCNGTRTSAAEALADWLGTDPTGSGDPDVLIIGDLNAYDKEDPIDALVGAGYADLHAQFEGEFAYTYLFDGQLGYLDHALSNAALSPQVTGAAAWHINADEPDLLDYLTQFKEPAQDAIYEPNAYRSSDHDPVIVGLGVCDAIAPTIEVSVDPDTLWPPNHKYVKVEATVTASDNFDTDPIVSLVSVTSDEPDNGPGDGDTPHDIVIVDDTTFKLRADRSGPGDGRTYTITYEVTDDCGNTTQASATVQVPENNGHHGSAEWLVRW